MIGTTRLDRWRWAASLALVFALVILSTGRATANQRDAPEIETIDPLAPPAGVTAKAVYVMDATTQTALYSLDQDERRSPASTTKLMTALVIADNTTDWQELVTADATDVLTWEDGESFMGLVDGDILTIEQMMYGLMLPSGNDAAHAMARFIGAKLLSQEQSDGDPVERFVQEMNNTAVGLGLQDTHFTNPAGLYDADHYTTARDLATIAAHAYAVPEIATASSTETYEFTSQGANPHVFTLTNTNKMLGSDGVVAGKTGTLPESLACLVIMRNQGENMVIGVLLGSEIEFGEDLTQIAETDHRFTDMSTILGDMDRQFRWVQPGDNDFPGLTQELTVWNVRLGDDHAIVLPSASAQSLRYLLQLGPPAEPNTPVGNLLIFDGDRIVAEKQVVQVGQS